MSIEKLSKIISDMILIHIQTSITIGLKEKIQLVARKERFPNAQNNKSIKTLISF